MIPLVTGSRNCTQEGAQMTMKKPLCLPLAIILLTSLCACGEKQPEAAEASPEPGSREGSRL